MGPWQRKAGLSSGRSDSVQKCAIGGGGWASQRRSWTWGFWILPTPNQVLKMQKSVPYVTKAQTDGDKNSVHLRSPKGCTEGGSGEAPSATAAGTLQMPLQLEGSFAVYPRAAGGFPRRHALHGRRGHSTGLAGARNTSLKKTYERDRWARRCSVWPTIREMGRLVRPTHVCVFSLLFRLHSFHYSLNNSVH